MELLSELSTLIKKKGISWNDVEKRYKEIYESLPEEKKNLYVYHTSLYNMCSRSCDVFRTLDIILNMLGYRALWVPKDCEISITLPVEIHKDKDGCVIHYSINSSSDGEFAESDSLDSPYGEYDEVFTNHGRRAGRPKGSKNKKKNQ